MAIAPKQIMQPFPVKAAPGMLKMILFILGGPTALLVIGGLLGLYVNEVLGYIVAGFAFLCYFGMPIIVFAWMAYLAIRLPGMGQKYVPGIERTFREHIGSEPKFMDVNSKLISHAQSVFQALSGKLVVTGSGVAYLDNTLYMLDNGVAVALKPEDIRGWEFRINGAQILEVYGEVSNDTMERVMGRNAIEQVKAQNSSGLFIEVASVQHPRWHFVCSNEAVLRKWNEILKQWLQEGREPQ